jgi:hypothetical protein
MTTAQSEATTASARNPSRWRPIVVLLLVAVVGAVLAVVVQQHLFPYYSGDRDEPIYRFQAELLQNGNLTLPLAQNEFFRPWLSGPDNGHLVMAFQPLWPAVLAAVDVLTGSMLPALPLAAVAGTVAVYWLALELLRDRRRACLAAALYSLSPFLVVLNATYLNYSISAAWIAAAMALAVRHARLGARWTGVALGAMLGALLLLRPFDAVVAGATIATYALVATPRSRRTGLLGTMFLGAVPFLALTIAYNIVVNGSPIEFSTTSQSGGLAGFGWGSRAIAVGFEPVNYTFLKALRSLGRNALALPTWMIGSYLGVVLAWFGFVRLRRTLRREAAFLLAMTLAFPIAYLAWWASALTTPGAYVGLGPHYYVPALIPLSILLAVQLDALWARHRGLVPRVAGIATLVVVTAAFTIPKIDHNRVSGDLERAYVEAVFAAERAIPGPLLVIQEREEHSYVMGKHGVMANTPDLEGRVLYAVDRGAAAVDLIDATDRQVYRVVRQVRSGEPLESLAPTLLPQRVRRAEEFMIGTQLTVTQDTPIVTAYARYQGQRRAFRISRSATSGDTFEVVWRLTPSGLSLVAPTGNVQRVPYPRVKEERATDVPRAGRAPKPDLVVGAAFARRPAMRDPDRVEERYYARSRDGQVELLTAPESWVRLGAPLSAWLPIVDDPSMTLTITESAGGTP